LEEWRTKASLRQKAQNIIQKITKAGVEMAQVALQEQSPEFKPQYRKKERNKGLQAWLQ
jgi:hypothetical protein